MEAIYLLKGTYLNFNLDMQLLNLFQSRGLLTGTSRKKKKMPQETKGRFSLLGSSQFQNGIICLCRAIEAWVAGSSDGQRDKLSRLL